MNKNRKQKEFVELYETAFWQDIFSSVKIKYPAFTSIDVWKFYVLNIWLYIYAIVLLYIHIVFFSN